MNELVIREKLKVSFLQRNRILYKTVLNVRFPILESFIYKLPVIPFTAIYYFSQSMADY